MEDRIVRKGQAQLKRGYTTGTCAAAAAKAAAKMLFTGEEIREVKIRVPEGTEFLLETEEITWGKQEVSCGVRKDAGDDPDITHGILIFANVCIREKKETGEVAVLLEGGKGVGRITRKGLEQPVGEAAINRVPRKMITDGVKEMAEAAGFFGVLSVEIFIPEGERLAMQTFNPRLGIKGGLSVLGTTGIVEPMSEKALTDTIYLEMKVRKNRGIDTLCIVPGNYGREFLKEHLGFDPDEAVRCSNYIGETLDMAVVLGIRRLLLVGHIGKFVKIAAGVMNTHSRMADTRAEVFAANLAQEAAGYLGTDPKRAEKLLAVIPDIMKGNTTDDMLETLKEAGILKEVMDRIMKKIRWHLQERGKGTIEIEVITFSKEWGILGKTDQAEQVLNRMKKGKKES